MGRGTFGCRRWRARAADGDVQMGIIGLVTCMRTVDLKRLRHLVVRKM